MTLQRIRKAIKRKINSRRGDSIAEVLIALLISSLALVMLASMITSSANMINSSKKKLNAYYEESAKLAVPPGDGDTASITVNGEVYEVFVYTPEDDETAGLQRVVSFRLKPTAVSTP